MDEWTSEWMSEWASERMNEWMNEWTARPKRMDEDLPLFRPPPCEGDWTNVEELI